MRSGQNSVGSVVMHPGRVLIPDTFFFQVRVDEEIIAGIPKTHGIERTWSQLWYINMVPCLDANTHVLPLYDFYFKKVRFFNVL